MTALLEERQKRQREVRGEEADGVVSNPKANLASGPKSLQSLVESVKRKSTQSDQPGQGKRRKL
jgi:hypothetical protein